MLQKATHFFNALFCVVVFFKQRMWCLLEIVLSEYKFEESQEFGVQYIYTMRTSSISPSPSKPPPKLQRSKTCPVYKLPKVSTVLGSTVIPFSMIAVFPENVAG